MNVLFTILQKKPFLESQYWRNAVACAERFMGSEVAVISDIFVGGVARCLPAQLTSQSFVDASERWKAMIKGGLDALNTASMIRWFLLLEAIKSGAIQLPIACPDWDVMILRDLNSAPMPPAMTIGTCWIDETQCSQSPFIITQVDPLEVFAERATLATDIPVDMHIWSEIYKSGKFQVHDLSKMASDHSVYDDNVANTQDGAYAIDKAAQAKRVTWLNGVPFFTHKRLGDVRANCIHCWGPYKKKTGSILENTTVKFSGVQI